jgi:hypothetical protein
MRKFFSFLHPGYPDIHFQSRPVQRFQPLLVVRFILIGDIVIPEEPDKIIIDGIRVDIIFAIQVDDCLDGIISALSGIFLSQQILIVTIKSNLRESRDHFRGNKKEREK